MTLKMILNLLDQGRFAVFFDLGNTWKILSDDEESGGFWLAGGDYIDVSDCSPLFTLRYEKFRTKYFYSGVGWVVLEAR